jgi:Zn-dependent metalloprotease
LPGAIRGRSDRGIQVSISGGVADSTTPRRIAGKGTEHWGSASPDLRSPQEHFMKKSNLHRLRLIAALAALSVFSTGQTGGIKPHLDAVQPESSFESVERSTSGDGRILGFSVAPSQIESVSTFFQIHAADFGLSPDDTVREAGSSPDDLGNVVHRFVQYHRGVQVLDSLYILYERDGRVISGHGNLFPNLSADVVPKISANIAVEKGRSSLSKSMAAKFMSINRENIRLGLVMHAGAAPSSRARLTYRINDDATATGMDVDAKTGEVFQSWRTISELSPATHLQEARPDMEEPDAQSAGGTKATEENVLSAGMTYYDGLKPLYVKKSTASGSGNVTYQLGSYRQGQLPGINFWEIPRTIIDPTTTFPDYAAMIASRIPYFAPSGSGGMFDAGVVSPDWYPAISMISSLQTVHSFLNLTFPSPGGTGGFVGLDGTNNLTYHAYYVSDLLDNAFYFHAENYVMAGGGNGTTLGPLVDLDILAHEIGHGIVRRAPANVGFAEVGEAASIDEGFGDVIGKIVEFGATPGNFSWNLAHRATIGTRLALGLRNLATPGALSDDIGPYPSTAGGPNHLRTFPNGCHVINDYCRVHHNATIVGHWYYRLVTGGSGINELGQQFDVFPLGHIAARRIAFLTIQQLGPSPTFDSVRAASLNAARVLFPDPVPGWVKSPEYIATMDAWAAVGVGDRFGKGWDDTFVAVNSTPQSPRTLKDVLTRIWLKYGYEGGVQFELSNSVNFTPNTGATPPQAVVSSVVTVNRSALPYSAETNWNLTPGTDHYWRAKVTSTDSSLCASRAAFCAWVLSRAATTAPRRIVPPTLDVHAYLPAHEWAWKDGVDVYYDPVTWATNNESSVTYWLDLAETTSPDFTSVVYKATARGGCDPQSVDCGTFTVTAPKNKTLLARVRAKTDWRDSLFNAVATAYSDTLTVVTPDVTVNLTGPADYVRVAPFGNNAFVHMTWATAGVLEEPVYEVATRSITFASNLSSPRFDLDLNNLSGLTDGREYFWTVQASSPSLYSSPYTQPAQRVVAGAVRHFVVDFSLAPRAQGSEPANNASLWSCTGIPDIDIEERCPIRFAWNAVPRASGYWLHIKRPNGSVNSFDMGTATSKMYSRARDESSQAGLGYEWWVTTKGPAPSYVSVESAHRRYTVYKLKQPTNTAPTHSREISRNSSPVTFSWTGDSRAIFTQLEIRDVTTGTVAAAPYFLNGTTLSTTVDGVRTPGHTYRWTVRLCPPQAADGSVRNCETSSPTEYSVEAPPPPPNRSLAFELIEPTNADFDMYIQDPNGNSITVWDTENYVEDSGFGTGPDVVYWSDPPRGTYQVIVEINQGNAQATTFSLRALRDGSVVSAPNFPSAQTVDWRQNFSGSSWPAVGVYTFTVP